MVKHGGYESRRPIMKDYYYGLLWITMDYRIGMNHEIQGFYGIIPRRMGMNYELEMGGSINGVYP